MVSFGITGGIGCGKSALASILRGSGLPLIDTDDIARDLLQSGQEAFREVVDTFGAGILDSEGAIDRAALAAVVFADSEARTRLERILHPKIQARWSHWLGQCRDRGDRVAFVVIPLLYEKTYEPLFDRVIAVGCSQSTQDRRLRSRGWSAEAIRSRVAAQLPVAEKMRRADFVIWNEGAWDGLESQCRRILNGVGVTM